MTTQPLYTTLLPWLPQEYQGAINVLIDRAHNSTQKASDFVLLNPTARGLTKDEMLDWIHAVVCLTFCQYFEDVKLPAHDSSDDEILVGLYFAACTVIAKFAAKYKGEHHARMTTANFVKSFLSIVERPLSSVDPNLLSFRMERAVGDDDHVIQSALGSPDWFTIKEFSPDTFDMVVKTAGMAKRWKGQDDVKIIPVEVLEDVLIINALLDQYDESCKDLDRVVKEEEPVEIIYEQESIVIDIHSQILDRIFKYYNDYEHDLDGTVLRLVVEEIVARFVKAPTEIIETLGPDTLCVLWVENLI